MYKILQWIAALFSVNRGGQGAAAQLLPRPSPVSLEQQLETLAQLGLTLNEGVTVNDLLYSWDRADYENQPFDTILFMLGCEIECEPWGRPFCDRVWNFDLECINEGTGSYAAIVQNLCRVAGRPGLATEVEDFVDIKKRTAWLRYTMDGQKRHYNIAVDNDWADPQTTDAIMRDIEREGRQFYAKGNGQAVILFYLDSVTAEKLNALTGNALSAYW